MIKLYDHQQRCVDGVREQLRSGSKSVLLQAATGSGKSIMGSEIVRGCLSKGNKCWFVVPRKQLLTQMAATFDGLGIDYGMVAAGGKVDYTKDAQICSLQTLMRKLDRMTPPDVAIIDECHFGGTTMDNFVEWLRSHGTIIIGMSATPWRLDGQPMGKWYNSMVKGEPISSLIKQGFLSDYRLFHATSVDTSGIRKSGGEFIIKDMEQILWADKKRVRGIAQAWHQHAAGKRTIVYGVSVADCERIAKELCDNGIASAAISGQTQDAERKRLIAAFADGEIMCLVNCDLLTFGFDLSSQVGRDVPIEAMIDAAPTMSLSKQLQKNGRALRRKSEPAIILDCVGNTLPDRHGLPDHDHEWSLLGRERGSRAGGEKTIAVRQCEHCHFCFPPQPVCPFCGEAQGTDDRRVDEVDAFMAEVDKEMMKEQAKHKRMEVGQARTIDDLRRIQRQRGYKPSWVFIQAKLKGIQMS